MISQFMILANSWFFSGINFMNSSQIHDFETKNSKKIFFSENFSEKFSRFFYRFVSYFFVVKEEVMNYRRRLEISAAEFLQKLHICGKYLDKHVKIFFTIIFWVTKIKFLWKLAKNRGLWKIFGPILRFYTKKSPRNSWSSHFMTTL